MSKTEPKRLDELYEGDCFFWLSPELKQRRENEIVAINEFRKSIGEMMLSGLDAIDFHHAAMSGYIVWAIVRETGERCVRSLRDDTYAIWYDGSQIVHHSPNKAAFDARLEAMREAQKRLQDEQQRMSRSRSKKENRKQSA